jgi:L-alanine-DL-glutamate epimerase-like enolase superfamily enzyme
MAADAVDVMQADATRCADIIGFLQVAAFCEALRCRSQIAAPLQVDWARGLGG